MRMKKKAAGILKKMMAIFTSAKSITDLKSKLRDLKTRLMIYSLLSRDKKVLFGSISHKFHDLFLPKPNPNPHHQPIDGTELQEEEEEEEEEEESNLHQQLPLVIHNNIINAATLPPTIVNKVHMSSGDGQKEDEEISNFISNQEDVGEDDQKDKYPDLRHSLFEDEDEMGRPGSVIELVKKSKEARKGGDIGEEFKLEDEIDEVADLFIKRFHRHMWIQKQNSYTQFHQKARKACNPDK